MNGNSFRMQQIETRAQVQVGPKNKNFLFFSAELLIIGRISKVWDKAQNALTILNN